MKVDTRTFKQKYTPEQLYIAEQILCDVHGKQFCDSEEIKAVRLTIELFRKLKEE